MREGEGKVIEDDGEEEEGWDYPLTKWGMEKTQMISWCEKCHMIINECRCERSAR